jgi:hypothetical protein
MAGMNEGQQADEYKRRGWAFARADPWRQVRMAFFKAGRTWNPLLNAAEFQSVGAQVVCAVWHLPLYGLGLLGVWCLWRRRWEWGVLMMPVVYFTMVHSVYLGSVRYRVPLMGIVHLFAAVGLSWLWDRWGWKIGSQPEAVERV